jgi:hypothetical protein
MVYGLWFMVYGLWFMVYGSWCMVYSLWFIVFGYRLLGSGSRFRVLSLEPKVKRLTFLVDGFRLYDLSLGF